MAAVDRPGGCPAGAGGGLEEGDRLFDMQRDRSDAVSLSAATARVLVSLPAVPHRASGQILDGKEDALPADTDSPSRSAPCTPSNSVTSDAPTPVVGPETFTLRAQIVRNAQRSLFGKLYTVYIVHVQFGKMSWDVSKRYSEFRAMHQQICDMELSEETRRNLPRFPGRRLVKNLSPEVVEERQKQLQAYLASVVEIPALSMTPPVLQFVGALQDRTQEEKYVPNVKSHLHIDQVHERLDSGDVVLFRTVGVVQGIQRSLLSSNYDHVGIVCRTPASSRHSSSLYVLEATADGVRKYPLSSRFKAWYMSSAIVVVRQLIYERTREFYVTMSEFCNEMDGKEYGLNMSHLIRKISVQKKNSYFCSEVVAHGFKRVGLLPKDVAANTYFPSAFSEKGNLQLLNGARLGPELLVAFKNPEVMNALEGSDVSDSDDETKGSTDRPSQ